MGRSSYAKRRCLLLGLTNILYVDIFIVLACKHLGQFLPDRYDACRYQVCSYGEPWKDEYGNLRLISMSLQCPPGTAVPYTYKGGFKTPCTSFSANCHTSRFFDIMTYKHIMLFKYHCQQFPPDPQHPYP